MRTLLNLFTLIALASCSYDYPTIEINNRTSETLTDLTFGTSDLPSGTMDSLKAGDSHSSRIILDNSIKEDGSYLLSYKIQDSVVIQNFGYFTNGMPLDRHITVIIESDTITYSFH